MPYRKLLIVIATLSLAALACSLAPETASKSEPTMTAHPTITVAEPAPATASPTPTPEATATPVTSANVNDDAAQTVALSDANDIQNVKTQLYIPNCVPRTDWAPYTIAAGDTLSSIARRYGTSWRALADANCLANPSLILPVISLNRLR